MENGLELSQRLVNPDPKEWMLELVSSGRDRKNTIREDLSGGSFPHTAQVVDHEDERRNKVQYEGEHECV
jgi:hypothetical protein